MDYISEAGTDPTAGEHSFPRKHLVMGQPYKFQRFLWPIPIYVPELIPIPELKSSQNITYLSQSPFQLYSFM